MSKKIMKNFNDLNLRNNKQQKTFPKKGQAFVEFVLVAVLIGIVSFWALLKLNPDFFRSYFKGSVSSSSNIDSNGQILMQSMGD